MAIHKLLMMCVCVCFRRKAKDSAGSRYLWCWQRRICYCLTVCHAWENTGSAQHTPTLCLPHGTHSHTALMLLHTSTLLKNQSRYTLLFNTCLCTHTCKHTQTLLYASWQWTKIHNCSQLERNRTKALRLLKACWSCMRWQLLLQGIVLKSKFNWTAAQISL